MVIEMKITVEDRMRLSDIVRKVENDELWLFGAHEWRRLDMMLNREE